MMENASNTLSSSVVYMHLSLYSLELKIPTPDSKEHFKKITEFNAHSFEAL